MEEIAQTLVGRGSLTSQVLEQTQDIPLVTIRIVPQLIGRSINTIKPKSNKGQIVV